MIEELTGQIREAAASTKNHYWQQVYFAFARTLDRILEPDNQREQVLLLEAIRDYVTKQAASHTAQATVDRAFIALFKGARGAEIEYRVQEKDTHAVIFEEYAAAYREVAAMLAQEGQG
jgi:Zn/Cd-binding protein ZinT